MSDLVERVARASYEAEVNRWPQYKNGFQKWEDVGPETKERFRFAARAAMAIVLEEAATAIREAAKASPYAKGRTQEFIYGLQDGYEAAAQVAIRKLGE